MVFCPTLPHIAPLFATPIDFGQPSEIKIFAFFQRKTAAPAVSYESVCLGFDEKPFRRGISTPDGQAKYTRCNTTGSLVRCSKIQRQKPRPAQTPSNPGRNRPWSTHSDPIGDSGPRRKMLSLVLFCENPVCSSPSTCETQNTFGSSALRTRMYADSKTVHAT